MNVFISFLGAIRYEETRYYFKNKDDVSKPTYYAQEAIFEQFLLNNWGKQDKIFIFTTDDAYKNNYANRIIKFTPATQTTEYAPNKDGLESILKTWYAQKRINHYESVPIANGNTVEEIWSVFQTIYDNLKDLPDGSKIYFDITFGFRSLPMLGIVLLNYVRTLHNVSVEYVFYGNYEVGRQEKIERINEARKNKMDADVIARMEKETPYSPILDLRPFVELQEWTTAARAFLKGGNAELLRGLMPLSHETLGDDLLQFTQSILTCRGSSLMKTQDIDALKNNIVNLNKETDIEVQLTPLLKRIEQKLSGFQSQTTLNGFAAVEWCIQNGLIQQGYTFLEETCKSYVIEQTVGLSRLDEPSVRQAAGVALNGIPRYRWRDTVDFAAAESMFLFVNSLDRNFRLSYKKMVGEGGLRNDINHCGHNHNAKTPAELKIDLKNLFQELKTALQIHVT